MKNPKVRVVTTVANKSTLQVRVVFADQQFPEQEMILTLSDVEAFAERYVISHHDPADLTFRKIMSYALNEAVVSVMFAHPALLHRAAESGDEELVRGLLREKETDVNYVAEFGWTALLTASAQGYPKIMTVLLAAGANPDLGNVNGITPLMYGARYGNAEVAQVLLQNHAKIDAQDVFGWTALIVATKEGHKSIVEMLLKAGADPTIKDHKAKTALDWAHEKRQGKIAAMLRNAIKKG